MMLKISALCLILMVFSNLSFSQVSYKIDSENSSMSVEGTSTIHDWEMDVEQLHASFELAEAGKIQSLKSGQLKIDVESIKSERSLMNKKTYEALKYQSNPQIKVRLVQLEEANGIGKAKVELTIAGKTQTVSDDFTLKVLSGDILNIQGEIDLKMTDYDVIPPVALMGTIKTGDEIKVVYDLFFKKQ